jgi:hypothetical protein
MNTCRCLQAPEDAPYSKNAVWCRCIQCNAGARHLQKPHCVGSTLLSLHTGVLQHAMIAQVRKVLLEKPDGRCHRPSDYLSLAHAGALCQTAPEFLAICAYKTCTRGVLHFLCTRLPTHAHKKSPALSRRALFAPVCGRESTSAPTWAAASRACSRPRPGPRGGPLR